MARESAPPEKGLPASIDFEKLVLGSIFLNDSLMTQCTLEPDDFSLEKHRRIYRRMLQLREDNEHIDRMTVANELMRFNELQACGGIGYLVSLDDGMPQMPNIDSYVRIVREKSILRKIVLASQHIMQRALADSEPADEILKGAAGSISEMQAQTREKSQLLNPSQIMESYGGPVGFMQQAVDPGVSFGFPQFDDRLVGLQPGCQYIIAGRTGSGKSSLAGNIATNLADRAFPVLFLSPEMSKEVLLARMICSRAEVSLKRYMLKDLDQPQRMAALHAAHEVRELPILIDDSAGLTITGISERVNEAVKDHKVRAFILDHIHRVNYFGDKHIQIRDKRQGVELASWTGCLLAKEHTKAGNPLSSIILCQLSRPADKRKSHEPPQLEDLRETAMLEQDATGVIMIHRPEQFKSDAEFRGIADCYVRKSRNGAAGKCELTFRSAFTKFYDTGEKPATGEEDE